MRPEKKFFFLPARWDIPQDAGADRAATIRRRKSFSTIPRVYSDEPDYFIAEITLSIKRSIACENIFTITPFDENDDHVIDSARLQMLDGSIAEHSLSPRLPGQGNLRKWRKAVLFRM